MYDSAWNFIKALPVYHGNAFDACAVRPLYHWATSRQGRVTWLLNVTAAMSIFCVAISLAACTGAAGAVTAPDEDDSVASIEVLAESNFVPLGGAVKLQAKVKDNRGRVRTDLEVEWSTSDPTIASVSESGTVTGKSRGRVTISASKGKGRGRADLDVIDSADHLPAFPEAEGWGAQALNECRSMPVEVLRVTNTATDGPGSLAQAVNEARSDRFSFVVFETGGHIRTPPGDGIRLNSSCVYIAGQTAPGDGVVIQGQKTAFWFRGGGGNISDIVMRYLRFRGKSGETNNHIVIAKGRRIVLDHMSFSWTDNYLLAIIRYLGMSFSAPIADVSIQHSIVSEVFKVHPTGLVINTDGPSKEAPVIDMTNISVHWNLLAHNSHRNPMTAADNTLVANNVIYNWSIGAGMMNRRGTADWVNNYAKAGPMTRASNSYVVNPYCDELGGDFSVYAAGNIGPMSSDPAGDNWSNDTRQVACFHNTGGEKGQEVPSEWRRDTEQDWRAIPTPVHLVNAQEAYGAVLEDAGANEKLRCDGSWAPALDSVDRRVLAETRNGSGVSHPPENEDEVGGYPDYATGTPCDDADRDGLPDEYEERFFECETCAEPGAIRRDGYLAMEHYLNGTTP